MNEIIITDYIIENFWKRVTKGAPDECWEWQGYKDANGYGAIWVPDLGKLIKAHRVSYVMHKGQLKDNVCHTCDFPSCVNPNHMFDGTRSDNKNDCVVKGRHAIGVKHPRSKLTEAQVIEIRNRSLSGETNTALAEEFGVYQGRISDIVTGKCWKHIGGPIQTSRRKY